MVEVTSEGEMSHCPHCGKAIRIVKALEPNQAEAPTAPKPATSADGSKCRKCGQTIYWEMSRAGKPYPVDRPGDRKAFHQCTAEQDERRN